MYAYEIANALGERGHDVDVYTQRRPQAETALRISENVTVRAVTRPRRHLVTFETLYYSVQTRQSVAFDQYDVVHGTLMPASTIALADRLGINTPLVLTSHSFALSEVFAHTADQPADYLLKYAFHPMNVVMDNIAGRSADRIIAISSQMEAQLTERYGIGSDKVTMISHGVDTERFHPQTGVHEAVSSNKLTMLFVGRLITRKGADLAIEAVAAAKSEDVELLIAGTGRMEKDLKELANDLGIAERVSFLGYVPDEELPLLYSSADATLFASNYEGFGLVLLESLASGTPVLGTPVGGVPDFISDGKNGFVLPEEAKRFGQRIDEIASDAAKLRKMSEDARSSVADRTWNRVAKEVEAVYENI